MQRRTIMSQLLRNVTSQRCCSATTLGCNISTYYQRNLCHYCDVILKKMRQLRYYVVSTSTQQRHIDLAFRYIFDVAATQQRPDSDVEITSCAYRDLWRAENLGKNCISPSAIYIRVVIQETDTGARVPVRQKWKLLLGTFHKYELSELALLSHTVSRIIPEMLFQQQQ